MDRRQDKEKELLEATRKMLQTTAQVKTLSKEVKEGISNKKDLSIAMEELKQEANRVKILQAESKVLSGWKIVQIGENDLPKEKEYTYFWLLIAIIAFLCLVKN